MITDYAKNIYRIEERMRDSEARAAEASKQVSYVHLYQSVKLDRAKKNNHQFLNSIIFKYNTTGRYLHITFNFDASSEIGNNSTGFLLFIFWGGDKKLSLIIALRF